MNIRKFRRKLKTANNLSELKHSLSEGCIEITKDNIYELAEKSGFDIETVEYFMNEGYLYRESTNSFFSKPQRF